MLQPSKKPIPPGISEEQIKKDIALRKAKEEEDLAKLKALRKTKEEKVSKETEQNPE